ncbi:MAG: ankyrin repeat domain-containing protein, partial [Pseudomonadota bacterium]
QREKLLAYMPFNRIFPNMPARELARAAGRGELRTIELLISSGVDVNTRGEKNATALYWALRRSNHRGFVKLLELGADPNVVFDDGGTVMHWAVDHKNVDFLRSALEYGGDPNLLAGRQTKEAPLFTAIGLFGNEEKMKAFLVLLDAGADVDLKDSRGFPPILMAAGFGRFDMVYEFLQRGADYSVVDSNGKSLIDAIQSKRQILDQNHELYMWLEKVVSWLGDEGVEVS